MSVDSGNFSPESRVEDLTDGMRASVLLNPAANSNPFAGMFGGNDEHIMSYNFQTGRMDESRANDRTANNIHGRKKFIVKMQPGASGSRAIGQMPWRVYDQTRSFETFSPPMSDAGMQVAKETMMRDGIFNGAGYKGYFEAQWEGNNVRIFVDKCAPPQRW